MISYYELGENRKLHEIVVAGTHDAGITGGGSGVQTQALNIGEQAMAGVRFFDVRIAAAVTSQKHESGRPVAELRAFHADDKVVMKLDRKVVLKGALDPTPVHVTQSKLAGGAFGLALTSMLQQARNFVHSDVGKNEFLILKFDKCTNWEQIADACRTTLGLSLYRDGGNLNRKTLKDLRGKVVVLFSPSGLKEVHGATNGILGFKNLSGEGARYSNVFEGLQYYGKGGTSPFNPKDKLKQNIKKQSKLMQGAAAMGNPEVVGMMYWTTTGLIESIKKRDDGMWDAPNVSKMKTLWTQGLGDFVNARVSLPSSNPLATAQQRRSYFPNIVMIDFADDRKCRQIRDLNDLSAHHLASVD
ncbi:MAG: hypothetical protein ACXW61_02510 [Gemmatirosa sp.]